LIYNKNHYLLSLTASIILDLDNASSTLFVGLAIIPPFYKSTKYKPILLNKPTTAEHPKNIIILLYPSTVSSPIKFPTTIGKTVNPIF